MLSDAPHSMLCKLILYMVLQVSSGCKFGRKSLLYANMADLRSDESPGIEHEGASHSINQSLLSDLTNSEDPHRRISMSVSSEPDHGADENCGLAPTPGEGASSLNSASLTNVKDIQKAHFSPRTGRPLLLWWPEIVAMLFSVVFMVTIAAVLFAFNRKPLASWNLPWQITPNTLISVLMTLCKFTMLMTVAECLGQLKWIYFQQKPHPLSHSQVFDDANRGPWGSLFLIFSVRFTAGIVSLGGIITVLGLAMEPFTQQVLSYVSQNVTVSGATVWSARSYDYSTNQTINAGIF